jgi:predicted kinase
MERSATHGELVSRQRPTLYIMVGLPGSGKTAKAREIEADCSALRLTPDEWIVSLFGTELDRRRRDDARATVEALQWHVARRVLSLGCSVVLDWGFWSRAERAEYRREAVVLGATVRTVFLDASPEELWARISQRDESNAGTLEITLSELDAWSKSFEPPTEEELSS